MAKLKEKFERATSVILVMPGGKQKTLSETERHACIHAHSGYLQNWEQRCSALYQVIGYMAHEFGVFDSDDVTKALDVAVGRGDVEKLLPWPNAPLKPSAPTEGGATIPVPREDLAAACCAVNRDRWACSREGDAAGEAAMAALHDRLSLLYVAHPSPQNACSKCGAKEGEPCKGNCERKHMNKE